MPAPLGRQDDSTDRGSAEHPANLLLDAELHLQDTIADYLKALCDRNALVRRFGGLSDGGPRCAL